MAMDPTELAVLREQTEAFISAWPYVLTLGRRMREENEVGGFTWSDPVELEDQVFAVVAQSRIAATERTTVDGQIVKPEYTLIGRHDADVVRGDSFIWRGAVHEVVFVRAKNDYETTAEVVRLGGIPDA